MKIWNIILIALSVLFFIVGLGMSIIPPEQFVEIGSIIAVVMISLPAFYGMWKIYGARGIWAILALGTFALIIESIGIYTGWPYSPFEYTMPFGYRLLGTTPWTVFIAWSPLVIGAWLLAQHWFTQNWSRFLVYIGMLVSADIVLDPGAVARGLWQYTNGGLWFDVPLQNFFGWIVSGTIAYVILRLIVKKFWIPASARMINNMVIASDSAAISENKKDPVISSDSREISPQGRDDKYILIASLSLILSIFLWSGVNIGYQLWLPAIIGIILGKVLIFGLFVEKKLSHK